jgi:hypothetical protein
LAITAECRNWRQRAKNSARRKLASLESWVNQCFQPVSSGRPVALKHRVTINPVSTLFPGLFQPNSTTSNASSSSSVTSAAQQTDASGLSPVASFLTELRQLQQQNSGEFNQLVSQISIKLQQAAQQASNDGDSSKMTQLKNLATQFQNAANGGQVPTAQQLQQADLSGHHHHGGHHSSVQSKSTNPFQTQANDPNSQDLLATLLGTTTSAQAS